MFTEVLDYHIEGSEFALGKVSTSAVKTAMYGGPCSQVANEARMKGIKVIALTMSDGFEASVDASIRDFDVNPLDKLAVGLEAACRFAEEGVVFAICCRGGCGRTGTFYILYRIVCEDADPVEAEEDFSNVRYCGPETPIQRTLIEIVTTLKKAGYKPPR